MKPSTESPLLVHPKAQRGEYVCVTPATAGWEHLHFAARQMSEEETWRSQTDACEYGFGVDGATHFRRS